MTISRQTTPNLSVHLIIHLHFFLVRPKSWQTNLDPGVVPTIASKNIHMHKIATTYYV